MTKRVNALNGYLWEPPIIERNALELFTTGRDLIDNSKRFEIWKDCKRFKSSDSISNAKKGFPGIGKFYGLLSNMYTHVSKTNLSPALIYVDNIPKLQFFGQIREGKENIRESDIYLIIFLTYICLQMTESCFTKYCEEFETIRFDGEKYLTKVTERHKKFADKGQLLFKDKMVKPLSELL